MKNLLQSIGLVAALAVSSLAQASSNYNYSYTFGSGDLVSGTFTGDASGDIISNIKNFTANDNGIALGSSGNFFGSHYDVSNQGPVISFDGKLNDFLFCDCFTTNKNYFISSVKYKFAQVISNGILHEDDPTNYANWSVTPTVAAVSNVAAVPEPETYALLLAGLGALGFIARRRKSQ